MAVDESVVAQSSIGVQLFYYDATAYKFKYLIPTTGEPPEFGSEPSSIEVTENDSPNKQYVSDRPDNPSIPIEYNYLPKHFRKIKENISLSTPKLFIYLLPLGSAFVLQGTGDTWFAGGNPLKGKMNITQNREAVVIDDINKVFSEDDVAQLKVLGVKKGLSQDVTTSDKLSDLIDWATIPADKISQEPKE